MRRCGDGSGMTGHHGWGYGQNDGRRRPRPGPTRWLSPPTLAPGQVSRTRKSSPSRPEAVPRSLPSRPAHSTGPPARPEPWLLSARRKVPAALCRLLRAAPEGCSRSDLGPDIHALTPDGRGGRRGPRAAGAVGEERCARCHCRERAPRACGDPPGAGLGVGKGLRQTVSPRGVPAYLSAGT